MKSNPFAWIAAFLVLCLTIVWWRQGDLVDEMVELRAEITTIDTPAPQSSAGLDAGQSVAPASDGPVVRPDPLQPGEERIAELERVVNAQADLLDKLLARVAQIDEQHRRTTARAWGPEQAIGAPDTMSPGDHRTAWAPANADGGVEWLEAEFENSADLTQVIVRQTCNPGTITKVVAITDTGAEVQIWQGEDPSNGQKLADTPFSVPSGITARRVRVYLDTAKLPGWEEIDALKIVGRDGSQQWARSVNASSTYAGGLVLGKEAFNYEVGASDFLIKSRSELAADLISDSFVNKPVFSTTPRVLGDHATSPGE